MFTLNGLHLRVCFPHLFQQKLGETSKKNSWIEKTCELLKLHPYLGKIAMLTNIAILDTTNANYSSLPIVILHPCNFHDQEGESKNITADLSES